jgi:hypothetical protein
MPHPVSAWRPLVDRGCDEHGREHRFPKAAPPWTNGPVERLNRPLQEATVQRYHDQRTAQLNDQLHAFLRAYHPAQRRKRLRGKTPHEFLCQHWLRNPALFTREPTQLTRGLYN